MYAESEKEYFEMNSVFDWIERPSSAGHTAGLFNPRAVSLFEPQAMQEPDLSSSARTTFACEPELARLSPTKRMVTLQNTYQLEPGATFKPYLLKPIIQLILDSNLQDRSYDKDEAPALCKFLADVIKDQASNLCLSRYKFISNVTIGQKHKQGFITASRCLWDTSRDNFTSASFENKSLFAVATLYALNYE